MQYDCIVSHTIVSEVFVAQIGLQSSVGYSGDDLSTRARIRDAALSEFARHGYRGASIRGIARAAGVSPGLVQHHFGSKERLRDVCDAHVMSVMREIKDRGIRQGVAADPAYLAARFDEMAPIIEYMVASLTSGSPAVARWFDEVTDYTYEVLTTGDIGPKLPATPETREIAAVQTAMSLGVTILFDHLHRVIGPDLGKSDVLMRVGRARLFLTSDRILSDEVAAKVREGLDRYAQQAEPPREEVSAERDE
jgi:AcrR family transcriptional regulator